MGVLDALLFLEILNVKYCVLDFLLISFIEDPTSVKTRGF